MRQRETLQELFLLCSSLADPLHPVYPVFLGGAFQNRPHLKEMSAPKSSLLTLLGTRILPLWDSPRALISVSSGKKCRTLAVTSTRPSSVARSRRSLSERPSSSGCRRRRREARGLTT